jgi:hypothetical protein
MLYRMAQRRWRVTSPVTEASWIGPRLAGWGSVGSTVPTGYPAYARICHPAQDETGNSVTWPQVAQATGRHAHSLMQWESLAGAAATGDTTRSGWSGNAPCIGTLAPETFGTLANILVHHTATADNCWFCIWEGWGWEPSSLGIIYSRFVTGDEAVDDDWSPPESFPTFTHEELAMPRVELPGRGYLLLTARLPTTAEIGWRDELDWLGRSPNLFWPANRSWCVATEIDFDSTLVAGSLELVAAIVDAPELDSWPIQPNDSLAVDGDHLNPLP